MDKIILVAGGKFRNHKNHVITILRELSPTEDGFEQGNRFVDTIGAQYNAEGKFMSSNLPNEFDLVEQMPDDYIETVDTDVKVEVLPGFFGCLWEAARAKPVKTAVIVGGGVGVTAYGVHNYRTYGNPVPPRVLGFFRRNA